MSQPPGSIRYMTLNERYSLFRQNLGHPHVILYVVAYAAAALPTRAFLETRIGELQARLPLLSARLEGSKTNKPGFVPGAAPWPVEDIVRPDIEFEAQTDAQTQTQAEQAEMRALFRREMERFAAQPFDGPDARPFLAVTRATPAAANADRAYLLVAYNHVLIDGRGSTLFLRALTAPDISYIGTEQWESPTRLDDTVSLKPSLGFLLPRAARELLLPKFPAFVQHYFTQSDPWPAAAVKTSPLDVPQDVALFALTAEEVQQLKATGKARGVATLHPLLKLAFVASVWREFHADLAPGEPFRVHAGTPRDERNPDLGHAQVTHNYVSELGWQTELTGSEPFWDLVRALAAQLASPSGLAQARMTIGLLAHIPDPAPDPASPSYDPAQPTGWERWSFARARSPTPYREGISVSNLGAIALPPGARDVFWGQTASPFGSTYVVNAIGHEGGVRITVTWREGCAVDAGRTAQVLATYRRVLARMCEAGGDGVSVADISA